MDFVHELENTPPMSDRTYANGGSPTSTKKMTNKHKALGKLDGKFRVDKINRPCTVYNFFFFHDSRLT